MSRSSGTHEFALYSATLPEKERVGNEWYITNRDLVHRMDRVLRLKEGEQCILFNQHYHALVNILQRDRDRMKVRVTALTANARLRPRLTFLLPLLKRDALAHAIYFLVEVGVNAILLMETQKSSHRWAGEKEQERLTRICIAAAEQSKHFAFPDINPPLPLNEILNHLPEGQRVYAHPTGKTFSHISRDGNDTGYILTSGPEGDFTQEEKQLLEAASFEALRLTPTILRAETAAFCIASLFRVLG